MKDSSLSSSRNRNNKSPLWKRGGGGILGIIFCIISLNAHARIYIQIDQPSEKKFPVAIADLVPVDRGRSKEWSEEIPQIIEDDLKLTGLFDIISPDQYPTGPGALSPDPSAIQFPPWTLIGAQALVTGSYSNAKDGIQIQLHLYDPFLGQHLLGRTYVTNSKDKSVVANHFADEVVKELTGEPGVFSTRIAYTQVVKKGKEIGVMDMNGRNARVITRDKTIDISPAWSPNGQQIAYTTFAKDASQQVVVTGSSGGPSRRVTSNGAINISPAWSPGGALTLVSALNGDPEIYLMNLGGDILQRLTNSFGIDVNPAWAPDGSAFVFASERAGRLHLFKAGASGGGVERLTFVGTQNDNPAWSPKGDKIAFQSLSGGWDIFVMNTDGSMIQRLTSTGANESPTWAPNGRFIAFSSGGQVTLMREDGSNVTPVGPKGSVQPAWGPWVK